MKARLVNTLLMSAVVFNATPHAHGGSGGCAENWTDNAAIFESGIQYDDLSSKANPTVHVLINGKTAKMMLDTGANVSVLWDESILGQFPRKFSEKLDSHVVSAGADVVEASLTDDRGNLLRQEFYAVASSVLEKDGYSGILSPQAVAQDNVLLLDFEKNCFFTSSRFDIRADQGLHVRRGKAIGNPHGVMAIPVELDGGKIPLIVDTGAPVTTILSSLVASKPKGKKSLRSMDVFGAEMPRGERMRLVDIRINGEVFKSHPVTPRPEINENGVVDFGYVGMDILKNRIIYYDQARDEFTLVARKKNSRRSTQ